MVGPKNTHLIEQHFRLAPSSLLAEELPMLTLFTKLPSFLFMLFNLGMRGRRDAYLKLDMEDKY